MFKILLHKRDETREGKKDLSGRRGYCRTVGDAMVQYGLSAFFGLRPEEIRIRQGEKGKPFLAGNREIYFNLSHSGEYVVCAFSGQEVGVDIERTGTARMPVAHRFFHPAEIAALEQVAGQEQDRLFFRYWSAKEAFLKYTGAGLTRPLSSFRVAESGSGIFLYEADRKIEVVVREYGFDPGYVCFTCVQTEEGEAEIIPFPLL